VEVDVVDAELAGGGEEEIGAVVLEIDVLFEVDPLERVGDADAAGGVDAGAAGDLEADGVERGVGRAVGFEAAEVAFLVEGAGGGEGGEKDEEQRRHGDMLSHWLGLPGRE
jgi:hypothetical protein